MRYTGPDGRPGTTPPVPGRPPFFSPRARAAFALCAALFALITWQTAAGGPLRAADERFGLALAGKGPEPLTQLLSDLGGMPVALPVLALALGEALRRGQRLRPLGAAVAMAAVPALVVPLKMWIDRPGPLTDATGYYPSGHTATAMVAYGGAALLLAPYTGRNRTFPVAVLLTLATGVGLVLRGYHWPLDVLGSLALCGMLLLLTEAAIGGFRSHERVHERERDRAGEHEREHGTRSHRTVLSDAADPPADRRRSG
ncbi:MULTISPECIES: phosphatase PAP2 family protein [unclassified Streptomyces]|uniref:phosphatase PAP2 family protein n=1 Tax=unclassified Streptomyces TaxID=2593676 RepID=UPI002E76A42A|nr:phosphatase PAP2 family protein [Streptomyces sp. JV176]